MEENKELIEEVKSEEKNEEQKQNISINLKKDEILVKIATEA